MKLKLLDSEFKPRLYQELIASTATQKNTLCILPTGLGKTYIAILVAAYRLEKFPESKILMLAPTRPLVNQHMKTFKKYIRDIVSLGFKFPVTYYKTKTLLVHGDESNKDYKRAIEFIQYGLKIDS